MSPWSQDITMVTDRRRVRVSGEGEGMVFSRWYLQIRTWVWGEGVGGAGLVGVGGGGGVILLTSWSV